MVEFWGSTVIRITERRFGDVNAAIQTLAEPMHLPDVRGVRQWVAYSG